MTTRPSIRPARSKGFTLIELMITVSVISILAAVALPSFLTQIRKSRRTEARNALHDFAARAERLYSTNNSYLDPTTGGAVTPAGLGYQGTWPILSVGSGYYSVTGTSTATSFTFTATATGPQVTDTQCFTFTVDNTGAQAAADSSGGITTQTCWN